MRSVEIPAGSAGATLTVPIPQWEAWQGLAFDVFEDGKHVDELSGRDVLVNSETANSQGLLGLTPTILLVGVPSSTADAVQRRRGLAGDVGPFNEADFLAAGTFNAAGTTVNLTVPYNRLPEQWLGYTGFDAVLLPFDKLSDLVQNHPAQWAAIRQSIAAGGNLWVYDVGDKWQRLAALEELLELDRQPATSGDAASGAPPSLTLRARVGDWRPAEPRPDPSDPLKLPKHPPAPTFLMHSLGRGQVVAIGPKDVFSNGKFDWAWLFDQVRQQRWEWNARNGVVLDPSQLSANAGNFWQFLIPGVGLTPVLQFQILISLFVILIGPVNYLLLRRWHKLNLLPITVGTSAAVATLALFGYAIVHDGLGVRVRARSFTELDQRHGEAVCWSRLSYYAGLSPSRGLTFSGDVAVYPLRIAQQQSSRNWRDNPELQIDWVDPEPNAAEQLPSQHFSSAWLPARTPTQFVTARVHHTTARLNVLLSHDGRVEKIQNRLGGADPLAAGQRRGRKNVSGGQRRRRRVRGGNGSRERPSAGRLAPANPGKRSAISGRRPGELVSEQPGQRRIFEILGENGQQLLEFQRCRVEPQRGGNDFGA